MAGSRRRRGGASRELVGLHVVAQTGTTTVRAGGGVGGTSDRPTGRVQVRAEVIPAIDLIIIGDSISAFTWHRGTTIPSVVYDTGTWFTSGLLNVTFSGGLPSGMTSTGDPLDPRVIAGVPMDGRKGFSSVTGKGLLVDALAAAGVAADRISLWEFACGGTTAGLRTVTTGAFSEGLPTRRDPVGGSYGCPPGVIPGGWQATDNRTAWLQTQFWLEGSGHPMEGWTLCDMIAHAPTGRPVVVFTLGGNDLFDVCKIVRMVDPHTREFDPTGSVTDCWDDIAPISGTGDIDAITEAIFMLNENARVVWVSYPNLIADHPSLSNPRLKLPVNYEPDTAGVDGPVGWIPYAGDGSNPPDPDYLAPNHSPATMPLSIWPAGAAGTSFPATWNRTVPGFMRAFHGWGGFTGQRDATYAWLRQWFGHWYADNHAWQGHGTMASPAPSVPPFTFYPGYGWGPSHNWLWANEAWWSGLVWFPNHRWNGIYNRIQALMGTPGDINALIVLTGGSFFSAHQLLTILTKDITTANIARVFRDMGRPRMRAWERRWRNAGRRAWHVDVWDVMRPGGSDASHDGIPAMNYADFVEGVHLTEAGGQFWTSHVAERLIATTKVFDRE